MRRSACMIKMILWFMVCLGAFPGVATAGHGFYVTFQNNTNYQIKTLAATNTNCMQTWGALSGQTIQPNSTGSTVYVEITQTITTSCRSDFNGHNVVLPVTFFDLSNNNGQTNSYTLDYFGVIGGPYYCASTGSSSPGSVAAITTDNSDQTTCIYTITTAP